MLTKSSTEHACAVQSSDLANILESIAILVLLHLVVYGRSAEGGPGKCSGFASLGLASWFSSANWTVTLSLMWGVDAHSGRVSSMAHFTLLVWDSECCVSYGEKWWAYRECMPLSLHNLYKVFFPKISRGTSKCNSALSPLPVCSTRDWS